MGGGDLNLKKSWHPNTAKNQEKVWKAEQVDAAEKRKLAELKKEINEERNREELIKFGQSSGVLKAPDDKKLEWMYQGSKELLNREDYLLGRTIDKTYEQLDEIEKQQKNNPKNVVGAPKNHVEHECIPFSIRQFKGNHTATSDQVDLARKLMEDPVSAIRQKEMETRRKILENPVKLKELHRLLKKDDDHKTQKNRKKGKKSKKSKSSRRKSSSSDEDQDNDLDSILAKKYKKVQGSMGNDDDEPDEKKLDLNKLLSMKYERLSKELDKIRKKHKKRKHSDDEDSDNDDDRRRAKETSRRDNGEPDRFSRYDRGQHTSERDRNVYDRRRPTFKQNTSPKRDEYSRNHNYPSDRQSNARRYQRRSQSPERDRKPASPHRNYRPAAAATESKRNQSSSRSRSRSSSCSRDSLKGSDEPQAKNFGLVTADGKQLKVKKLTAEEKDNMRPTKAEKPKWSRPQKQNLNDDEKERKRREMMSNAQWRDHERQKNVTRYREDDKIETEMLKDYDKDFMNKQLTKAARTETVASRIKSNINNIQRSGQSMSSHFARR